MAFKTKLARPITPQIVEVEVADQAVTPRKLLPDQLPELFLRDSAGNIIYDSAGAPVTISKLIFQQFDINSVPPGIGRFVPRNCPAAPDFAAGAGIIVDSVLHVNGLNLSGIIPRDAIAAVIIIETGAASTILISPNQTTMYGNSIYSGGGGFLPLRMSHVINLDINAADRCLDYDLTAGVTINIWVTGWYI